jgi:glucose-1-phosphate thymidylyltransferase
MYAIIPAGGYAIRLGKETENKPKHLLDIGERLILDHIMDKVYEIPDIAGIVVVTNAKFYDQFLDWGQSRGYDKLTILNDRTSTNEGRLGTIGDILFAIDSLMIDRELMVVGGDNLFHGSLAGAYEYYRAVNSPVVCSYDLGDIGQASNFGVIDLDEENKIVGFVEKPEIPQSTLISTLIYFFPAEVIKLLRRYRDEGNNLDRAGDFVGWLIKHGDVYSYLIEKWWDIGSPDVLREVREKYRST